MSHFAQNVINTFLGMLFSLYRCTVCTCMIYTPSIFIVLLSCASGESVQIRVPSSDRQFHCPGEVVIFTCETMSSLTIEWRSTDYIDSLLFQYGAYDPIGTILYNPSNHDIFANFTGKRNESGLTVLESQLHVRIGYNTSSPSVTCVHANISIMDTIKLRVLGMCVQIVAITS